MVTKIKLFYLIFILSFCSVAFAETAYQMRFNPHTGRLDWVVADASLYQPSDVAYSAAWDGDTTTAASKNALYDKIEALSGVGEVNTASNTGSLGVGLFKQKTISDLEFYKIASANAFLTAALSGTDYFNLTVNAKDEDDMVSDSASFLATQQSIKAYAIQDTADIVKDTHIDWGTGAGQVSAGDIPIADSGGWFETDDVESALAETGQHLGFYNGTFHESFDAVVTATGGVITMSLEQSGGGDLVMRFSDGHTTLDTTPADTIVLTAGTDSAPQNNYIYIPQATKILTKSTTGFPTDAEHIRVAYFFVPSDTHVENEGVYVNQNWNDHIANGDNQGHMAHLGEWIRQGRADGYFSGLGGDGDGGTYVARTDAAPDTVFIKMAAGVLYQFHRQAIPAKDSSAGGSIHFPNSSVSAYEEGTDLYDFIVDADGDSMSNKYYNLTLWTVGNKGGEYSPFMINLPTCSYNTQANAEADVNGCDITTIPREFVVDSNTGHLLARLTMKHTIAGQDLELISTVDLRGTKAQTVTGGGGSSHDPVTLTGTPDYISIAGQVITVAKLDPADDLNTFASSVLHGLLTDKSGTGLAVFGTSPTFITSIIMGAATLSEAELEILDGATATTTQLNYLNASTGTTGTTNTNVVFSTSPTLVTPALGTPSSVDLSNATNYPSASPTTSGISELATVAELEAGTDTGRTFSPDVFAGSNQGERIAILPVFDWTTDTATGDGKFYLPIPSSVDGMNLVEVHAEVITAGTTGTLDIQIHNVDNALDMLSTKLTVDSAETGSDTAATAAVINTSNDHVNTYDVLRVDIDAIHTTAAKGLLVTLIFRLP